MLCLPTHWRLPHTQYEADQALIRNLGKLGIHHMYTDYWTCYKVAFLAEEQLTCDVLGRSLEQGNNRYLPYVAPVEADPHAAYVFPVNSPQTAAFVRQVGTSSSQFIQISLESYMVYVPR